MDIIVVMLHSILILRQLSKINVIDHNVHNRQFKVQISRIIIEN